MIKEDKPIYFVGLCKFLSNGQDAGVTQKDHDELAKSFQDRDPNSIYIGCSEELVKPLIINEFLSKTTK